MKNNLKEIETLLKECSYDEFQSIKNELLSDDRKSVRILIEKTERRFQKYFQRLEDYKRRRIYEDSLLNSNIKYIAGVDEVGRGPLAGAVYASAVILDPAVDILDIKDSKKLSHLQREVIASEIKDKCIDYSIGIATVDEIDRLNIFNATKLAMRRAIDGLRIKPEHLLIDALELEDITIPQTPIIKGDDLSISIGAASIIAKVERDKYMDIQAERFPQYGFEKNKGYGTEEHIKALKSYGITEIHRRTFLKNIL